MSSPPGTDPAPPRRPRASLTRAAIVDAAVAVLDRDGLDGLTMRAVASELGAGAMSLYRHVDGRDALLDLVAARLMEGATSGTTTGDWRADLATLAREVRAALLRRPHLALLLTARASSPGSGLATLDHALGVLRSAGFGPTEAALANHALGNYVAGAALWEGVGLEGASGSERERRAEDARKALERLPAGAAPNVAWAASALFAGSAADRFDFGLAVLIDGLEARRPRSRRAAR